MRYQEQQLTFDDSGHTLNRKQCFSPDDQYIVFDTRNDDTRIAATGSICLLEIPTGSIREIYHTENQSAYGPGVGAASFSPCEQKIIFIQGIRNSDQQKPYDFTRRTGISIELSNPFVPIYMDARDIIEPFTSGALRGGTHAHSWSGDGQRISFTYNDYVIEQRAKLKQDIIDLRTVGVMVPGKVEISGDAKGENNDGDMFSVVITEVTDKPKQGSDEINKAFDECWIGKEGYLKTDGSWQSYAIAFQGNVLTAAGEELTEVYVVDLPDDLKQGRKGKPLEGTADTRPNVPYGVQQRRLTFGQGVTGPRHWLASTPDGTLILFLSHDKNGIVQIFGISVNGGEVLKLTSNDFDVTGGFSIHPDGRLVAYIADQSLFITDIITGDAKRIGKRYGEADQPVGAVVWSNSGNSLAYNRYITTENGSFLQIFVLNQLP